MSAKDDLELVEALRATAEHIPPGQDVRIVRSRYMRLLSLAERGARFTLEHEAELKAWRAADDEALDSGADRPGWTSWRDHARRICAMNEQREKEDER